MKKEVVDSSNKLILNNSSIDIKWESNIQLGNIYIFALKRMIRKMDFYRYNPIIIPVSVNRFNIVGFNVYYMPKEHRIFFFDNIIKLHKSRNPELGLYTFLNKNLQEFNYCIGSYNIKNITSLFGRIMDVNKLLEIPLLSRKDQSNEELGNV